jgi:hypothetical protein
VRWLHRYADAHLRAMVDALRVERRALRVQNRELRDALNTLTTVASIRSARIGQLEHQLADARAQQKEQTK